MSFWEIKKELFDWIIFSRNDIKIKWVNLTCKVICDGGMWEQLRAGRQFDDQA